MENYIELIQNLVNKIEEDVAFDVSIALLAKEFNLSPWHFQRMFKSIVGDSLGAYIRGRRLTKASKLLLNSQDTIIQIAFDVGFSSHEAFTRSFKAYFSFSPKQFRKVKPKVVLNEKPLLTQDLLEHISNGMHQEPTIITLPERILVGIKTHIPSPFVTTQHTCDFVYKSWMTLFDKQSYLKHRIERNYFGLTISPSGNFTEEKLDYIAGIEVVNKSEIPEDMVQYVLPKTQVAIFSIKSDLDSDLVKKTIDYIYGYWLLNSEYTRGIGDDYEYFEDVVSFMEPTFKSFYVLPVVKKTS